MSDASFDPVWEEKFSKGHGARYPWDVVVSFVFRYAPRDRPRGEVRILEVGCGIASNLWFAAREGFQACGVEASASAVAAGRKRFAAEGLAVDLREGSFTELPFASGSFDMVFDRGALTCCGFGAAKRAVAEVRRVLRPGGRFLFNPYCENHFSASSGRPGKDGVVVDIAAGSLVGCGQLAFYSREQVLETLGEGWNILSFQYYEFVEEAVEPRMRHSEWRVVVEKT